MENNLEQLKTAEQETVSIEQNTGLANLLGTLPESLKSIEKSSDSTEIVEEKEKETLIDDKKEDEKEEIKVETVIKEEVKEIDEESFITTAKAELGVEDDEEDEETVEGLINVAKRGIEKVKKEYDEKLQKYEKHPQIAELTKHLEEGGSVISFQRQQQVQDFSKIEVGEDNIELQENFYRTALQAKGMDEDDIQDSINLAKDKGTLLDKAEKSKEYLIKAQEVQVKSQIESEKAERQKEIDSEAAIENEVKAILKSGKIVGVPITVEEANELEEWGLKRNEKGLTARDIAWNALTTEQTLLLDKIVKGGFKGLGTKITPSTSKPLSELKKKETKTISLQSTGGSLINSRLGITNPKELFENNNQ